MPAPESGNRATVLVVDDEEPFRRRFVEALSDSPDTFQVLTADGGAQAVEIIRQRSVDLLIADSGAPLGDGSGLLSEFMRLQPGKPVIVLSQNGTSHLQRELGKHDGVSFLSKTTDVAEASRRVSERLYPHTQGYLEGLNLFSVLQLLEIERKTCILRLSLGERRATLWIRNGEIDRAEVDDLTGDPAIMALVDWKTPRINIENVSGLPGEESAEASRERKQDDSDEALTAAKRPHDERRKVTMANLKETLSKVSEIDGFIGACVVDSTSGMMLGSEGGGAMNLEIAAAGNTEVVRAKRKTISSLGLNDSIEDILITLNRQYHLIRPLAQKDGLFMYLVLDKAKSNLAMARHGLADAERNLQI